MMVFCAVLCAAAMAGCVADIQGEDRPFPKLGEFPPVPETTPPEAWESLEKSLTADRQGSQDEEGGALAAPLPKPAATENGVAGKSGQQSNR